MPVIFLPLRHSPEGEFCLQGPPGQEKSGTDRRPYKKGGNYFMARLERSTNTYPHPFSKQYWADAASELKSTERGPVWRTPG